MVILAVFFLGVFFVGLYGASEGYLVEWWTPLFLSIAMLFGMTCMLLELLLEHFRGSNRRRY